MKEEMKKKPKKDEPRQGLDLILLIKYKNWLMKSTSYLIQARNKPSSGIYSELLLKEYRMIEYLLDIYPLNKQANEVGEFLHSKGYLPQATAEELSNIMTGQKEQEKIGKEYQLLLKASSDLP